MIVRNLQYYDDMDFEDYLKLPGVSYSSLSGFSGPPSDGMRLGSRVHQYLNEPNEYDWNDAATVIAIASELKKYIGHAYLHLEKEVAFTADFIHNGMMMAYRGRADMMKAGRIVVDIKILSGSLEAAIERFGYAKQLSGYCIATGAPLALIVAFNRHRNRIEAKSLKPNATFWEYQIVKNGKPI